MRFDHVIYAAADLGAATSRVAQALGIEAVGGGEHEGQGTHNDVLPFPGGYVEVLALVDPDAPPASPFAAALAARLAAYGEGPFAWAVSVDDVEAVSRRTGASLSTIARDGFSARLAGLGEAMNEPALPFFIERDPGVPTPYRDGPGVDSITVEGDRDRLRTWLGELPPYLEVGPGDSGVTAVTIAGRVL